MRPMFTVTVELAERFDSLDQADIDNRLEQLRAPGFDPSIGWGELGTAITFSFRGDGHLEVAELAKKTVNRYANPNKVDIVKTSVSA